MSGELAPGSAIGRYRVVSVLGRGGMGVVYRARDASGREVAVKVVAREAALDLGALERFEREVGVAAAVAHENLLGILDRGVERGAPYVVLELLTGGTLEELVRKGGPLDWPDAVAYAIEIARGLSALHAAGIVHRDLKPQNVLLDAEKRARVADFGLARRRATGQTIESLTKTGEVVGTLAFMAPEQAEDSRAVDHRADLYALGCVIFFLLAGEPPFAGQGFALLKQHLSATPRLPSAVNGDVPPALDALVRELLAKAPGDRPATAAMVEARLEAIAAGGGGAQGGGGGLPGRARGLWAAAAALGALAVSGGVALAVRGGLGGGGPAVPPPPSPPPPAVTLVTPPGPVGPAPGSGFVREDCRELSVSDKKTMRLEAVSGFFVHGHGPLGRTKAVALSPDERRAVSVGEDGTLALHDLVTRAVRVVGRAAVQDAVFVTNERVLLGLVDGDVELWDLDGSASIASFTGLIAPSLPVSVAVSADRKLGASAGAEGVRVFDAGTLAEPRSLAPLRLAARCVAFYPDGKRILASYQDGRARVLDVKTGRELPDPDFEGQGRQELPCVAISQDGPVLVAALNRDDNRATIRVVKGSGRTARGLTLEDYWKSSVHGVAFARGGRAVVAVGDGDETLHVWDVATGEERTIATPGGKNAAVAVFKDGRRVLCGDERGLLPIVDLDARAQDAWHTNVVRSMAFTRDGKRLVSSSKDGTILVWDAAGKLVSTLNGLDRKDRIPVAVNAIALLPGDAEVLAAMYRQEGALRRFSLEAGLQEMSGFLNLDAQNILSVTLSPDGALAATGDAGGNIRLFRVNDGSTEAAPFAIIPGERVYLASIAFSPTGSRLLACGQEGRLAVWEVATRRQLIGPREVEHRDEDELPAVFIDDRHVLAGTTTGALRIIDLKMWTEEAVPAPEPHSPVRAIALLAGTTPDAIFAHGERALVSTHDGFVRLVDLVHKVELDRLSLASVATDAESFAVAPGERSFAVGTYHGAVLRFALDGPR